MPASARDASYIWDILEAARVAVEATRSLDFGSYQANRTTLLAVERCIEIIGEAARRLSGEFKQQHPEIPWAKIVAQRNVLAHEYRDIRHEKIWQVAREELPRLIATLEPTLPPRPDPGAET